MAHERNCCPICGAYAFAGDVCRPQCDPGNLRRAGIELVPLEMRPLGVAEEARDQKPEVSFLTTKGTKDTKHRKEVF